MNLLELRKRHNWKRWLLIGCLSVVMAIYEGFAHPWIMIRELEKQLAQTPR